jgi:hypothetical protein
LKILVIEVRIWLIGVQGDGKFTERFIALFLVTGHDPLDHEVVFLFGLHGSAPHGFSHKEHLNN